MLPRIARPRSQDWRGWDRWRRQIHRRWRRGLPRSASSRCADSRGSSFSSTSVVTRKSSLQRVGGGEGRRALQQRRLGHLRVDRWKWHKQRCMQRRWRRCRQRRRRKSRLINWRNSRSLKDSSSSSRSHSTVVATRSTLQIIRVRTVKVLLIFSQVIVSLAATPELGSKSYL